MLTVQSLCDYKTNKFFLGDLNLQGYPKKALQKSLTADSLSRRVYLLVWTPSLEL